MNKFRRKRRIDGKAKCGRIPLEFSISRIGAQRQDIRVTAGTKEGGHGQEVNRRATGERGKGRRTKFAN
jgi:hypothetical protein